MIRYEIIREHLQLGDALLYRYIGKKQLTSLGIQAFNHHCHCGVYSGLGQMIHYTVGGCKESAVEEYIEKEYIVTIMRFKNASDMDRLMIPEYARLELGENYDYKSLLGYAVIGLAWKWGVDVTGWNNVFDNKNSRVCSSGYSEHAKKAGLIVWPGSIVETIMPDHIYQSPNMYSVLDELKESIV